MWMTIILRIHHGGKFVLDLDLRYIDYEVDEVAYDPDEVCYPTW